MWGVAVHVSVGNESWEIYVAVVPSGCCLCDPWFHYKQQFDSSQLERSSRAALKL